MDEDLVHRRAMEDYSQFAHFTRSAAQGIFAANAGAALAMMTSLTALAAKGNSPLIDLGIVRFYFALGAAFFLWGVFLVLLSSLAYAQAKKLWGAVWDGRREANVGRDDLAHRNRIKGRQAFWLERLGFIGLIGAALSFAPGSAFVVVGLLG